MEGQIYFHQLYHEMFTWPFIFCVLPQITVKSNEPLTNFQVWIHRPKSNTLESCHSNLFISTEVEMFHWKSSINCRASHSQAL